MQWMALYDRYYENVIHPTADIIFRDRKERKS